MGRPVTPGEIEQAATAGRRQVHVPGDAIVTTAARERATALGVEIVRGGAPASNGGVPPRAGSAPEPPAAAPVHTGALTVGDIIQAAARGQRELRVAAGVAVPEPVRHLAQQRGIRVVSAAEPAAASAPPPAATPTPPQQNGDVRWRPTAILPQPVPVVLPPNAPSSKVVTPADAQESGVRSQASSTQGLGVRSQGSPSPAAQELGVRGQGSPSPTLPRGGRESSRAEEVATATPPAAAPAPATAPLSATASAPAAPEAPAAQAVTADSPPPALAVPEPVAMESTPAVAAPAAPDSGAGSQATVLSGQGLEVASQEAPSPALPREGREASTAPSTLTPALSQGEREPFQRETGAPLAARSTQHAAPSYSGRRTQDAGPSASASPSLDPITIDLIENALRNVRYEMDAVLFRTAMSPGIREQHDEFPLIADPQGRMVVGQFGSFIHGFLERYEGTIEEGDVFLLNDPYACAGAISHLNDWLVLMPLYHEGRLVGWASMFGHMTDVGGAVPGSMPIDARTIHSEGVIIRPFKLYARGVLDESGLDFILHQVRLPEWNRSDLMGIVAACRLAERRVRELCDRFGRDVYLATLDALLDRNYRAIKELIRRNIPETPQSFEDWVDDDGTGFGPYRVKCTVWREGDRAVFDWSGTDPQSPAAINFYLNPEMLKMFVGVYLIMVFDPQILFNDGFYPLIDVRIPEGSLLNPRYPAALSGRTHALGRVFDVFGGALGKQTPEFMNGAGFSDSPHLMYSGYDSRGEWFQLYQIGFGGVPGRPIGDGLDGHSLWPEFTNVPNEYLESYYPLVMERYECVPDSGGAGKHRGGCGMDVVYRFLADGEISIHDDRWLTYPWGVLGGKPGARSTKYLVKPDGRRIILPSKGDHLRVERGDVLHFVTWGGGGWGDPLERDPERVLLDVRRGFVTVESARADYGVVITPDERVDLAGTERLRAEQRARRTGPLPTFDFGPPIEEIRLRCREETGLEPPAPPVFHAAVAV